LFADSIPVIIPENPLTLDTDDTVSISLSGKGTIVKGSVVYPKPGFVINGVVNDPEPSTLTVAEAVVPTPIPMVSGAINLMSIVEPGWYPDPDSTMVRDETVPPTPIDAVIFPAEISFPSTIMALNGSAVSY